MKEKRKVVGFYLSERERTILAKLAADAGLTKSAYLRFLIRQINRERKTIEIPRKKSKLAEYV